MILGIYKNKISLLEISLSRLLKKKLKMHGVSTWYESYFSYPTDKNNNVFV